MTLLDVVVDEARVARGTVETFIQVLEEHRNEHSANCHAHDCQSVCCQRLVGYSRYLISECGCVRCHGEPRPQRCYTRLESFEQTGFIYLFSSKYLNPSL